MRLEPSFVVQGVADDGLYTHFGLRHTWRINEVVSVVDAVRAVHDSGVYGLDSGWNLRADVALEWALSPSLKLRAPAFRAFVPLTHMQDRSNQFVVGVGVLKSF